VEATNGKRKREEGVPKETKARDGKKQVTIREALKGMKPKKIEEKKDKGKEKVYEEENHAKEEVEEEDTDAWVKSEMDEESREEMRIVEDI
jgi:hypothetical protein